jgi:hypothetical protein
MPRKASRDRGQVFNLDVLKDQKTRPTPITSIVPQQDRKAL